jgi:hypothetical protein
MKSGLRTDHFAWTWSSERASPSTRRERVIESDHVASTESNLKLEGSAQDCTSALDSNPEAGIDVM